jgi:putative transcriptional regulator
MLQNRIKHYRDAKGWSQQTLAGNADISLSTLQKVEQGQSKPSVDLAFKIAQTLGVTVLDVFVPISSQILLNSAPLEPEAQADLETAKKAHALTTAMARGRTPNNGRSA